jgi:hypothetical protein
MLSLWSWNLDQSLGERVCAAWSWKRHLSKQPIDGENITRAAVDAFLTVVTIVAAVLVSLAALHLGGDSELTA